ncbi:MAG: D-aminoacylase [Caldilineaceae bacterium]
MPTYTTLIRNAKVVDGTGNPWFYGDVALKGDRIGQIAAAGSINKRSASEVVEADGKVVAPGFIDILSHSIIPLMVDGRDLSKITQGVTTEIMGEDWTPAPFEGLVDAADLDRNKLLDRVPEWKDRIKSWKHFRQWLEASAAAGVSPNIGSFLGGGTVRQIAMGAKMGKPSAEEMATMRRVTAEAMEDGAMGVSYALIYPPSSFTDTNEIVEVCKVVSRYKGVYITHIRSEAGRLLESLEEAIEIGQRAKLPVEIYHLKAAGRPNWPKMSAVIERINRARAAGIDITADMYPYAGAGTGLTSVLPPWADADAGIYENLKNPELRAKIRAEAIHPSGDWEAMVELNGAENVMPVGFYKEENKQYISKRLSEIAAMRKQEWVDAAIDLLISEGQRIGTIYFMMDEANVRRQLQLPWITIGTDAGGFDPVWGKAYGPVHPRGYGSYPRILGKYVREEGIITLEDCVRKMSGAVAQRLSIRNRGILREGYQADVLLFDPATISDRATFDDPHQLSVGMEEIWVNGERVLRAGEHTGAKPGRVVNGPGWKKTK